MTLGFGLTEDMFDNQRINFHTFEGNKNGSAKEHKFRILPAYAPGKLFHKVGLHWGFKDAGGKMKALTCSLEAFNVCPICDKVNEKKGMLENITAALSTEFDPAKRAGLEEQSGQIEEYISDHRRKPTFMWNIVTEEGTQKVLQLSWNGHDPLFEKTKFIFNKQGIDVTNLKDSTLMYANRSGLKAKTRYQYEMLANMGKDLTPDVTSLTDLGKVYVERSLDYLQIVVDTEVVPADEADPNDRDFNTSKNPKDERVDVQQPAAETAAKTETTAAPETAKTAEPVITGYDPKTGKPIYATVTKPNIEQQITEPNTTTPPDKTAVNTAQPDPAATAVKTETPPSEPAPTEQVNLTNEQDKSVTDMMAALNPS